MASVSQWDNPTSPNFEKEAQSSASRLGQNADEATSSIGEKADKAAEAIGSGMESLGETIRKLAPKDGILGTAGQVASDALHSGSQYLEENGLKGVSEDMTKLIRNNPVPAVLVGIGFGFLLAKVFRR